MEEGQYFTAAERKEFLSAYRALAATARPLIGENEFRFLRQHFTEAVQSGNFLRDSNGINRLYLNVATALILSQEVGLDRSTLAAVLTYHLVIEKQFTIETVERLFGADCVKIIHGLIKANSLYAKQETVQSDNFRNLLLTFAEDVRVIIIMIANRLCLMRMINHHPDNRFRESVAYEAAYLYAPLAHRLGLYRIKTELEDLSLKYTQREEYDRIARKLSETKKARDKYIQEFIAPIKEKLLATGLKFEIKGRVKSISSILNKIRKQNVDLEGIYDLFAIRVVLDSPLERESADCWHVYSIITDMYRPNPKRLKDWLSVPKSNGYESLHITVWGPGERWVEVQIRTKRMDEIAERGLAAHWKYKGQKSEKGLDEWLNNVRDILESGEGGPMELMKELRMNLYDKEVFVFTPKGDLYKLPKGATILDFAFLIHTQLGAHCTGGKVNGKNQTLRYKLQSGDTIEILTASTQKPKQEWLTIATTTKAKVKIKQLLNELLHKEAEMGKELLARRFKNRKIDIDDAVLMQLIRKTGHKTITDFYSALFQEKVDINRVIDLYHEMETKGNEEPAVAQTAGDFVVASPATEGVKEDELVIDQDIKGLDYKLSKCCNPIFGDPIFGFISSQGAVKIHRMDCPNAANLRAHFGYRIVKAHWAGKIGAQYAIVLYVVGNDDIGIVTNITSIISKEKQVTMRNISIDSNDGLFQGHITVLVNDTSTLNTLIKKIKTIKGVKDVTRETTLYSPKE